MNNTTQQNTVKIQLPTVENMTSHNGNKIPNQFIIRDGSRRIFKSYDSIIAVIENGKVILDSQKWDYSTTTGKYRNIFLGDSSKKETEKKIKSGVYQLADLN